MSITKKEFKHLIDLCHLSEFDKEKIQNDLTSYIRRSMTSITKMVDSSKNHIAFHIDFTKEKMNLDIKQKREMAYKECIIFLICLNQNMKKEQVNDIIDQMLSTCFKYNLIAYPQLIFLFKHSNEQKEQFIEYFSESYISGHQSGLNDLLLSNSPNEKARQLIKDTDEKMSTGCPFSYLGPCKPDFFVGRQDIIREIMKDAQNGFAITGGRRIGKSSLLLKLRQDAQKNRFSEQYFPLYIDCSTFSSIRELTADITRQLNPKLYYKNGPQYLYDIEDVLKRAKGLKNGKKILLLLDEIDILLNKTDYEDKFSQKLRASLNNGYARLVISGFRELSKLIKINKKVFFNLCEGKTLGTLDQKEVRTLIIPPFKSNNITFYDKEAFISILYEYTSGHPSFVQFIAKILFQQKQKDIIDLNDIEKLKNDRTLIDYILDNFLMNTSIFERFICLIMLDYREFNYITIFNEIIKHEIKKYDISKLIQESVNHLLMNSIFVPKGESYQFLNPLMVEIIKKHYYCEAMLNNLKKEIR